MYFLRNLDTVDPINLHANVFIFGINKNTTKYAVNGCLQTVIFININLILINIPDYPFGVVGVFICVSVCPSVRPFVRSSVRPCACTCKFVHVVVLAILFRVAGV